MSKNVQMLFDSINLKATFLKSIAEVLRSLFEFLVVAERCSEPCSFRVSVVLPIAELQ
jgi:hypothetical protein